MNLGNIGCNYIKINMKFKIILLGYQSNLNNYNIYIQQIAVLKIL